MVPSVLMSPLEEGIDSALLRSALGIPLLSLRILAAVFHIDSFLCSDLGVESEQDFDSVSKRAACEKNNISLLYNRPAERITFAR